MESYSPMDNHSYSSKDKQDSATIDTRTPSSIYTSRSQTPATSFEPTQFFSPRAKEFEPMRVNVSHDMTDLGRSAGFLSRHVRVPTQGSADSLRSTLHPEFLRPPGLSEMESLRSTAPPGFREMGSMESLRATVPPGLSEIGPMRLTTPYGMDTESLRSSKELGFADSMRPSAISGLDARSTSLSLHREFGLTHLIAPPTHLRQSPRPTDPKAHPHSVSLECFRRPHSQSYHPLRFSDFGGRIAGESASHGVANHSVNLSIDPLTHVASRSKNDDASCTTLMLRDLPAKCTKNMLLQEIKDRGFINDIDFFYLPIDVRRKRAAGYCFVNLTNVAAARRFRESFDGIKLNGITCHVATGHVQGQQANVELYRKSPVMALGADFHPLIFEKGVSHPLCTRPRNSRRDEASISTVVAPDIGDATTLMLRGIPNKYTRDLLLEELEERGILEDIDFVYLPIDLRYKCNVGYCFVNLTTKEAVGRFCKIFEGLALKKIKSSKICAVTSGRVQGRETNIDLYRNTSVMTMRDEYQPIILKDGKREPFPPATISRLMILQSAAQRTGVSCRPIER